MTTFELPLLNNQVNNFFIFKSVFSDYILLKMSRTIAYLFYSVILTIFTEINALQTDKVTNSSRDLFDFIVTKAQLAYSMAVEQLLNK